jgi:hypothetical protein
MSFPIQINAIELSCTDFSLGSVTGTMPTNSVQTVQLEPGNYRLLTHAIWLVYPSPSMHGN